MNDILINVPVYTDNEIAEAWDFINKYNSGIINKNPLLDLKYRYYQNTILLREKQKAMNIKKDDEHNKQG